MREGQDQGQDHAQSQCHLTRNAAYGDQSHDHRPRRDMAEQGPSPERDIQGETDTEGLLLNPVVLPRLYQLVLTLLSLGFLHLHQMYKIASTV